MSILLRSVTRPLTGKFSSRRLLRPSIRPNIVTNPRSTSRSIVQVVQVEPSNDDESSGERQRPEHAVISTFDLFSIGGQFIVYPFLWYTNSFLLQVGPSSSHTVGPMRAANIFITDLIELNLLEKVKIFLFIRAGRVKYILITGNDFED